MNLKKETKNAFAEVQRFFPFDNYIHKSTFSEMYAILRELKRYLPEFRQKRLLDIGCGPMEKTAVFQSLGFRCYAADDLNDPWHHRNGNIKKIKEYAEKAGINFYHQKPGEYTIPFEVGSFDVVCSLSVIEHLHESPRGMLNFMGTYAKPNGLLVIVTPNSVNLRKRLSVLFGRTNYAPADMFYNYIGEWRGHVREYTLEEVVYICEASGFEVLTKTTFEHFAHLKLDSPLKQLYLILGSLMPKMRSGLLAICRKPESWKPAEEDPEACRHSLARCIPAGVA